MDQLVRFPSNGTPGQGYLAIPESGSGPGVVVLQEWWGLNDQITETCDELAAEGFVALAPDLFRGRTTREPDEAGKMMMSLNIEQAAKDMVGAVRFLATHDAVSTTQVGVVGFCMGGGLALWLGTLAPEVGAVVAFYGAIPWPAAQPDFTKLSGPVQGHYAGDDDWADAAMAESLRTQIETAGKSVELFFYDGAQHAFTNHHRPEVFHPEHSRTAWERTRAFFHAQLH